MYPDWANKMVFVEVLVNPASNQRTQPIDHSQDMYSVLMSHVKNIHEKYGRDVLDLIEVKETPALKDVVALFAASDVALVSTFWDGLNLMPYEYTAAQPADNPGALIISEFMGCSRSLNGVLRVNPWSLEQVSTAIHTALNMTLDERKANHFRRYNYVMNHTIEQWGIGFVDHLDKATKLCSQLNYVQLGWGSNTKLIGVRSDFAHLDETPVTAAYRQADRRVLLLDYDGTLTPADKTAAKSRVCVSHLHMHSS